MSGMGRVKIASRSLTRAERTAAERAATDAVEQVRREEARKRCPKCNAPILRGQERVHRDGLGADVRDVLLEPNSVAVSYRDGVGTLWRIPARPFGSREATKIRDDGDMHEAIYREHRCPEKAGGRGREVDV